MKKEKLIPSITIKYYNNDSFLEKDLIEEHKKEIVIAKSIVEDFEVERKRSPEITSLGNTRGHSLMTIIKVIELLNGLKCYKNFKIQCDYNYTANCNNQYMAYYLECDIIKK